MSGVRRRQMDVAWTEYRRWSNTASPSLPGIHTSSSLSSTHLVGAELRNVAGAASTCLSPLWSHEQVAIRSLQQ